MKTIHTDQAPAAVGPYSQAIVYNDMLYTSGQIGLDPISGKLAGDSVDMQTMRVTQNLSAVLRAANCSKSQIIKTTIYLTDMDDFATVNRLYEAWLGDHRPARSTVTVAALPLGAKVEVELIAHL